MLIVFFFIWQKSHTFWSKNDKVHLDKLLKIVVLLHWLIYILYYLYICFMASSESVQISDIYNKYCCKKFIRQSNFDPFFDRHVFLIGAIFICITYNLTILQRQDVVVSLKTMTFFISIIVRVFFFRPNHDRMLSAIMISRCINDRWQRSKIKFISW